MADMMTPGMMGGGPPGAGMPPMGGAPPGGPPGGGDPIKDNLSMFNPTDLAMMKQGGAVDENTSVREFLTTMGIDVEGPVTQLAELAQKQVKNKTAMGKFQSIASKGQGQAPPPGMPPQGAAPPPMPPQEEPNMANLLG